MPVFDDNVNLNLLFYINFLYLNLIEKEYSPEFIILALV